MKVILRIPFLLALIFINAKSFSQVEVLTSPDNTRTNVSKSSNRKAFVHPGLLQNSADLGLLKKMVLAGEQPWKDAFEKVRQAGSAEFFPKAFTHISRGTGGRLSKGGNELLAGSRRAYTLAMLWNITGEKQYAEKAIQILNLWSATVWDFDDNDAKLLAAWTGHVLANAAEILRYTSSGWQQQDIDSFRQMLLTVYYPLIKNFFPEANGNWDGAIINTLMCIGIFCDRPEIFDEAVKHFIYSTRNGSITKYVYPTGQCEESTRDQGHVQLGLGEFAEACQVAWTQGVDLYGVAGNRLALGFEYTAKYMAGEAVPAYGKISEDGRGKYRDVYEGVYQHYHFVKGLDMPYTKRAIDSTQSKAGLELLSACRVAPGAKSSMHTVNIADAIKHGALDKPGTTATSGAVRILPGESIQEAIDKFQNSTGYIILAKGVHVLPQPLRLKSGLTLAGEGKESILTLDPKAPAEVGYAAIINGEDSLSNVLLRDFVVEGAINVATSRDPNQDRRQRASQLAPVRGGILLLAQREGQLRNIQLKNITVRHCTHNGVSIKGAIGFKIIDCDFNDNGGSVAPGWGGLHNLLLFRVSDGEIRNSRFSDSPWGSGIDLTMGSKIVISQNELSRNYVSGICVSDSKNITIERNLVESNDSDGISQVRLFTGNQKLVILENSLQYNQNR